MKDITYFLTKRIQFTCIVFVKIAFPLLLFVGLVLFILSARPIVHNLQDKASVVVLLKDNISSEQIAYIDFKISKNATISKATYLPPSSADSLFLQHTGEDVRALLGFSPVPGSYIIKLSGSVRQFTAVESLIRELKEYPGIAEVTFEAELGKLLFQVLPNALLYLICIAAGLGVVVLEIQKKISESLMEEITAYRKKRVERGWKVSGGKLSLINFAILLNIVAGITVFAIIKGLSAGSYLKIDETLVNWNQILILSVLSSIGLGISGIVNILITRPQKI